MSITQDVDPGLVADDGESAIAPTDRAVVVIDPTTLGLFPDLKELRAYRDLFRFLVWRGIKVRYSQSILGVGWAVAQPVVSMVVFTIVFGRLARMESDEVPYAIFSYAALVPWTYFANAVTDSTGVLIQNANMISKVYFPRIILPLASIIGKLVDFMIAMVLMLFLMAWYGVWPTNQIWLLPVLVLLMVVSAGGIGIWLSALAVQYRDVKYGIAFVVQLLMYAAPVVYSVNLIPEEYRLVYALNPMVGVIEGFRAVLLGTRSVPWGMLGAGSLTAATILLSGAAYFRSRERLFADVA